MRSRLLVLALLGISAPLGAQTRPILVPRASILWDRGTLLTSPQDTLRRATTGAGTGTWVGAGIGAAAGYLLAGLVCGLGGASSCGRPQLVGILLGGLTGAMIGSAFEGDQPPAASTRELQRGGPAY